MPTRTPTHKPVAFSAMRGPDGKIPTGVWDFVCLEGRDLKDGAETEFSPETLSQMIGNFVDRGDMVMYDYNHQGLMAQINGQPAPALAWCGGLAAVWDGEVIADGYARGVEPTPIDPAGRENGLYALRSEVTEMGEKLMPGFKYLSPGFTSSGVNRQGEPIGYQLLEIACENIPWQAGTELAAMTAQLMAAMRTKLGSVYQNTDAYNVVVKDYFTGQPQFLIPSTCKKVGTMSATGAARATEQTAAASGRGAIKMSVSDSQIRSLMQEAGAHGDSKMADTCRKALNGDASARRECEEAIADAQGMGALMSKLGIADGDAPEQKLAKFKAACMDMSSDDLMAAAKYMDAIDGDGAKAMARKFRAMAKMDAADGDPARMAAPFEGKETPAEEAAEQEAMSALKMSLTARGVTVPAGAKRADLIKMAAALPPAPAQPDLAALKNQIKQELAHEAAAEAEKAERGQLVKMARDAKAPAWALSSIETLPIAMAREAAKQYGAQTVAPAHLFGRVTAQGGPISAPGNDGGARDFGGLKMPKIHKGLLGDVIAPDEAQADAIKAFAFSNAPADIEKMSRVLGKDASKAPAFDRLVAAGKVIDSERPDLGEHTQRIRMGLLA